VALHTTPVQKIMFIFFAIALFLGAFMAA